MKAIAPSRAASALSRMMVELWVWLNQLPFDRSSQLFFLCSGYFVRTEELKGMGYGVLASVVWWGFWDG
jgi:hypothetical protein